MISYIVTLSVIKIQYPYSEGKLLYLVKIVEDQSLLPREFQKKKWEKYNGFGIYANKEKSFYVYRASMFPYFDFTYTYNYSGKSISNLDAFLAALIFTFIFLVLMFITFIDKF